MIPPDAAAQATPGRQGSTRDRILRVSKNLFASRGYEHASTSSIARLAGTSESQLMKHFGSKAGLLEAIFIDGWSGITGEAQRASSAVSGPAEKLLTIAQVVFTSLERDPELKLLLLLEGRRIRREGQMVALTDGFMNFVRLVDGVLVEMSAANQLRPGLHPQAVRCALMGMLEGMLRDRFLSERLGYPANFDGKQLSVALGYALSSFIQETPNAAVAEKSEK